jgi:site-specific DNA recombinase
MLTSEAPVPASTDQGLEQEFNSLDAQYDASQAYIRSQAHAGWSPLRGKIR